MLSYMSNNYPGYTNTSIRVAKHNNIINATCGDKSVAIVFYRLIDIPPGKARPYSIEESIHVPDIYDTLSADLDNLDNTIDELIDMTPEEVEEVEEVEETIKRWSD